jgi:alginate O-acetyltransferase complex protein AlgI
MLFNSYEFIFLFLPASLAGYFALGARGWIRAAVAWLAACSLFFYGWWDARYVLLLVGSILFNFAISTRLSRASQSAMVDRRWLALGVCVNLALLGYYKYANFFVDNLNALSGAHWYIGSIVLPLGISFFTFTQIAFLVDAYRKEVKEYRLLDYALFVTFFPHLIAGPVLHHREIMPQFRLPQSFVPSAGNFGVGLTIFFAGLFKKVVIADSLAQFATPMFTAAAAGETITGFAAWGGVIAYTMQLYFDFSGYSDMAIGLARLYGIRFPLNFNSPYRAGNIIDFWRRWNMTLSRFLRDYVYFALGGNRRGRVRRHVNLMATMLLGGLWHGAGWPFVIWGGLHGLYLVINHGWRAATAGIAFPRWLATPGRTAGWLLTFLAVVIAWVFFRSDSMQAALRILQAMAGMYGFDRRDPNYFGIVELRWLVPTLAIAWFAPNVQQIMQRFGPALETYPGEIEPLHVRWLEWQPNFLWALATALVSVVALINLTHVSEFLYFQF